MLKDDFPFFSSPWVYLDSAATTQKPNKVIDTVEKFYKEEYSTVHRTVYDLSIQTTDRYEKVREKCGKLINADYDEIVFCKGTTDGINLVAKSFSKAFLKEGDTILISEMEHHSNIVPWQLLAEEKKLKLKWIPLNNHGALDLSDPTLFNDVKLVAVNHISNVTGVENPVEQIIQKACQHNAKVLIDGAQAIAHKEVDVKKLGCDFYVFSGHKLYGPTGVGVLYGKKELLEKMPPVNGGGDMIDEVFLTHSTYQKPPMRFEAGTPLITQVIGLGAAIDYVQSIGIKNITDLEDELYQYFLNSISSIECIIPFHPQKKSSIFAFEVENMHTLDVATLLNLEKICIRSGHLCCQPYLRHFNKNSLCRVSFGLYNTKEDIDLFVQGIKNSVYSLK